jgi:2-iminobutanoate/2-iminopropanoate deaminase
MKLTTVTVVCLCIGFSVAVTAHSLGTASTDNRNHAAPQEKANEYLNPAGASNRPFSEAVRAGDWLILSGKLGTDSSGKLATGGIKAETKQTLDNIRGALERYGSSMDDVVKCTVMLADMKEWGDMNEVYTTYFKKDRMPTRSAFGVSGLALNARVEIECWANKKR